MDLIAKRRKFLQILSHTPPLFSVVGLVVFWLFFMFFGSMIGVEIFRGDPKDSMSELAMWLGYLFLLGTIMNIIVYPVIWSFLSIFNRELFPGARYVSLIFFSSLSALYFLWPKIEWFLD